jgi:AraC-like DNA-binding protein
VLRATWREYQLTPAAPVLPIVRTHPRATALEVDLHDGIEVGMLLSGKQERHYPELVVNLKAGDVWLQPMWEPHAWRVPEAGTECLILIFLPEFLGEERFGHVSWLSLFAAPVQLRPWVRDRELRSRSLSIGREMAQEIAQKERGWEAALRLGLLRLLFGLSRHWSPPTQSGDIARVNTRNLSRVMPAIALIQERRPGTASVEEAAGACGLSRSRFTTLFRQTMGTSFGQFSLRARLGFAAHRLLSTDLTVEVIAQRAGFVDASHFHRTFVKHYGRTPSQYRARAGVG